MVYTISEDAVVTKTLIRTENCRLQWLCIFIASLPLLSQGLQAGWIAPVTPLQHTQGVGVLPDVVPWVVSCTYLAAAASSPLYGYINDKLGARKAAFCISVPQTISWILLLIPDDTAALMVSRVLSGIAAGGVLVIIPSYLKEISKDGHRGMAVTVGMAASCAGYLVMHAMGALLRYHTVIYSVIWIPILHMAATWVVLDSPGFLVKVGRVEEALQSLVKLRGSDADDPELIKQINRLQSYDEKAKSVNGHLLINIFRNQIWRSAFKICVALHTVRSLGGSFVIVEYASEVLVRSQVELDHHVQILAVPIILLLSVCVSLALVDKCGRRILLTISSCTMGLSLGVLAVYMQTGMILKTTDWVPLVALVAAIVGYGLGFYSVPCIVMTEVLNMEIRSAVLGIIFAYIGLLDFIQIYTFKYIENYIGLDAIMYTYAGVNMYGAVYTLFVLPETTNKSIVRIEKEMKRKPLL